MELLYVWIKEYNNIENQGFNLSPKFNFRYNEEAGQLKFENQSKKSVDNFFGVNILNITAVVGENGSGKSSLLKAIASISNFDNTPLLVIYRENDKLFLYKRDLNVNHNLNKETLVEVAELTTNFSIIFSSNLVDSGIRDTGNNVADISSKYLLACDVYDDPSFDENEMDQVDAFIINEKKRQIEFILSELADVLPFTPPKIIELDLSDSWENINMGKGRLKILKNGSDEMNKIWELISWFTLKKEGLNEIDYQNKQFGYDVLKSILLNFLVDGFYDSDKSLELLNSDFKVLFSLKENCNEPKEILSDFFNSIILNSDNQKRRYIAQKRIDLINFLYSENIFYHQIDITDLEQKKWLNNFFDLYKASLWSTNFLDYSWRDLSSGENALLNLFSRLYCKLEKSQTMYQVSFRENIILLLDEGETFFHPKWQKNFIHSLIYFLKKVTKKHNRYKFQIILTSHSPFVLSDLPKENIIFLKNKNRKCVVIENVDKMKNTFGANIHSLLANGFFLDGLIGDFAKSKIEKVNRYLNNEVEMEEEVARNIIDMIGEPIIKKYLEKRLEQKSRTNEVTMLKERIEELESKLKS